MDIIKSLEKEDRNIYTGAIGYLSPDDHAVFNVAIRTILLQGQRGEMGIGSGITYDSDPEQEWAECLLKASFLMKSNFQLIETMSWSYLAGIPLLPLHLERLKKSAEFFGFPFNREIIDKTLSEFILALGQKKPCKIRLLLNNKGTLSLQAEIIPRFTAIKPRVAISAVQTDPDDLFLRHKTTARILYNQELAYYKKSGYYDVLFTNTRGEITEGAISNIFIKKGNYFYTPPLSCGLLPGVYREYFIRRHGNSVREKPLYLNDFEQAEAIFLTNAIQGLVQISPIKKSFLTG